MLSFTYCSSFHPIHFLHSLTYYILFLNTPLIPHKSFTLKWASIIISFVVKDLASFAFVFCFSLFQAGSIRGSLLKTISEDKAIMRPRIGSRPPKCERRCRSCEHCEAIQVPTNPQAQNGKKNSWKFSSVAYARLGGSSNYKPMSWKCKCGNLIFNP
ncbi:EPIDERMAL PATTERNING FACTOR-like protein 5 isoform X1 [Vigna unguiculata]|uniref:EPIDERMAL PATTERNING FACTOR-like protein 5 isoform X1 n=1 Tax=Vigna unguiculata TaxID=3917 RepID=UPI001016A3ED|nr:EPIDERMAL PATTERNING FACTOR-like protein 5 isoform X1 [Vigna unguiculata]